MIMGNYYRRRRTPEILIIPISSQNQYQLSAGKETPSLESFVRFLDDVAAENSITASNEILHTQRPSESTLVDASDWLIPIARN